MHGRIITEEREQDNRKIVGNAMAWPDERKFRKAG